LSALWPCIALFSIRKRQETRQVILGCNRHLVCAINGLTERRRFAMRRRRR
jgi:hypothetical protein